jgi:hypothetical protein
MTLGLGEGSYGESVNGGVGRMKMRGTMRGGGVLLIAGRAFAQDRPKGLHLFFLRGAKIAVSREKSKWSRSGVVGDLRLDLVVGGLCGKFREREDGPAVGRTGLDATGGEEQRRPRNRGGSLQGQFEAVLI